MKIREQNWVFLGDSLTEGVGSSRVSYVSDLTCLLRQAEMTKPEAHRNAIHEFRLRQASSNEISRFVKFNTAGFMNTDKVSQQPAIWLWNLACEGQTIVSDLQWLPLLKNLQPERIFIFRGSLENILRPSGFRDNQWPWWVPKSWRGYAAMDPRCYYSSTWWRKEKQMAINKIKQSVRMRLLRQQPGVALMGEDVWLDHYRKLLYSLRPLSSRIHLLGLLPVSDQFFPNSRANFLRANNFIKVIAGDYGAQFIDWHDEFLEAMMLNSLYYLDGFHPNKCGAEVLATILLKSLNQETIKTF
jgi:hypothetical protein